MFTIITVYRKFAAQKSIVYIENFRKNNVENNLSFQQSITIIPQPSLTQPHLLLRMKGWR